MSRNPTAQEMAAWPAPNYVDPETRRPLVLGVEIPLCILVIAFVTCRFYSRTAIIRALGADDWFMLAAAITSVGASIMTCLSTLPRYQTGYHLWDLTPANLTNPVKTGQMAMALQLLFPIICALTKVSILLTYLRIFPSRLNKWFCYILIVYEVGWCIGSLLAALFQCSPPEAFWEIAKYSLNRKCIDVAPLYYATGCLNILSDFLIFLWPAKDLYNIQISLRQRLTLIAMFSLGIVICVAGVCRIWYTSVYVNSYDSLFNGATLYAIVAIETSLGIICGCLPGCKPLMSKLFPHFFSSTHGSTNPTHKKSSKLGGQSFPFQSLNGGIRKEEGYSVEYGEASSQYHGKSTTATNITVNTNKDRDGDTISAESQEWIMMQDHATAGPAVVRTDV